MSGITYPVKCKAAVMTGFEAPLEIKEISWDAPKVGEVLVDVATAGVCHSDLHYMKGDWSAMTELPFVLGHEGAGIVRDVGPGVTRFAPGDHVIFLFWPNCGVCNMCQTGKPGNCQGTKFTGGRATDGTFRAKLDGKEIGVMGALGLFSQKVVVDQNSLVAVPDKSIPLDRCAIVGCSVTTGICAAINTGKVEMGSSVAVVGCGGVGLNVIQGARLQNASTIIGIDLLDNKLELAKTFGATHTINGGNGVDVVSEVMKLCPGGVEFAFDAIGNSKVLEQIVNMLRPGGAAIEVGIAPMAQMASINPFSLAIQEKRILGSLYGSARPQVDMPRILSLYKQGRCKLDELISCTLPLDKINEGFDMLRAGSVARAVIDMQKLG